MKTNLMLCLLSLAVLTGCGTPSITSVVYKPADQVREGPVYFLPRTSIEVKAKFEVWVEEPPPEKPEPSANDKIRYGLLILAPEGVTVTPALGRDPHFRFVAESNDSIWFDVTDQVITIDEKGILTGVNSTFEDKRLDVVGNVIGGALNIAKTFFLFSTEGSDKRPLRKLQKYERTYDWSVTYTAEDVIKAGTSGVKPFAETLAQITKGPLEELAARFPGFQWAPRKPADIAIALLSDGGPAGLTGVDTAINNSAGSQSVAGENATAPAPSAGKTPATEPAGPKSYDTAEAFATAVQEAATARDIKLLLVKREKDPSARIPGIAYRVPTSVTAHITIDGVTAAKRDLEVFDSTGTGYIDISGRSFSKRSIKTAFTNGRLTKYEKGATSAANNAASSFATITKAAGTAYTEAVKAGKDADTAYAGELGAEIARKRDLAKVEIELASIERQIALNQAKLTATSTDAEKETIQKEHERLTKLKLDEEAKFNALQIGATLPKS